MPSEIIPAEEIHYKSNVAFFYVIGGFWAHGLIDRITSGGFQIWQIAEIFGIAVVLSLGLTYHVNSVKMAFATGRLEQSSVAKLRPINGGADNE